LTRYQLKGWGPFLATRERGRQARHDVIDHLSREPAADVLVLDFSGVESITASFGDELVAKLALAEESGDSARPRILIEGASEDVRATLQTVLARRHLALTSSIDVASPVSPMNVACTAGAVIRA
jgi:hypothetical protein